MSRILKVSQSDYRVAVQSEGTITLDVGPSPGKVVVTGDLYVEGNQTTVNTTNLDIEDNIITLNKGESGAGITEGSAGITIDRGSLLDAQLLFKEAVTHYNDLTSTNVSGTWALQTDNGIASGLVIGAICVDSSNPSDVVFDLKSTTRVLKIANSTASSYASRLGVTVPLLPADTETDNYIPNKKFITTYIQSGVVTPGMADVDKIYKSDGTGNILTKVQSYASNIQLTVGANIKAQISTAGVDIENIRLSLDTITNTSAVNNLILTATNNNVEVNAVLNLDDQVVDPTVIGGKTKLYSKAIAGPGKSGLFFRNLNTSDELVSKNRALLFSMLF